MCNQQYISSLSFRLTLGAFWRLLLFHVRCRSHRSLLILLSSCCFRLCHGGFHILLLLFWSAFWHPSRFFALTNVLLLGLNSFIIALIPEPMFLDLRRFHDQRSTCRRFRQIQLPFPLFGVYRVDRWAVSSESVIFHIFRFYPHLLCFLANYPLFSFLYTIISQKTCVSWTNFHGHPYFSVCIALFVITTVICHSLIVEFLVSSSWYSLDKMFDFQKVFKILFLFFYSYFDKLSILKTVLNFFLASIEIMLRVFWQFLTGFFFVIWIIISLLPDDRYDSFFFAVMFFNSNVNYFFTVFGFPLQLIFLFLSCSLAAFIIFNCSWLHEVPTSYSDKIGCTWILCDSIVW